MEKYNTFGARFFAGFIDGLIFLPISLLNPSLFSPERGRLVLISWALFSYPSYWLYCLILHAKFGQTVGKMAMKIKVLDVSERTTPTFRQAFLRDIGEIVPNIISTAYFISLVVIGKYGPGIPLDHRPWAMLGYASLGWFAIEIISMLTNIKRRALHDLIAQTVVVKTVYMG